ncbi:MAG: hypothetical protein ACP5IL_14725 [Syntrophobacteraceae bacterium]
MKDDLKVLELGSDYLPRFSKDTTAEEVRETLENLKRIIREKRASLISKYQDNRLGDNEEKIREIDAAAERILSL